jgi:predicted amidohydrolase
MKVTVCELPNEPAALEKAWAQLVEHVQTNGSELVLLPEMPFFPWLAHTRDADSAQWDQAVQAHEAWMPRLEELAPATVASTRPVIMDGKRQNAGYILEPGRGARNVHSKYYLPDEPGFWEASWYERGDGDFSLADTSRGRSVF